MLSTHHTDTLNTYLVDANLRMAKLLNILTYLGWVTVRYGRVGKLKTRVGKRKKFFGALRRILPTLA